MHIAFLDTNTDRSPFAARHPSEVDKFRALLEPAAPGWTYADFRTTEGAFPQTLAGIDGVMISGSPASVNSGAPWVARLEETIRNAVASGIPVFGACFGHQAVARALGGTVAKNPQGWVLGRIETDNHSPAPWMGTAPSRMSLHAAHKEQVTALPRGGVALAGTAQVPNGHVTVGPKVFTTQYHPELSRAFMAELIDEMAPDLPPDLARTARESLKDSTDERLMAQWIARFVGGA